MIYKIVIPLIVFVCIGLIALSIAVGVAHRDVVVVDDPYEVGLKFDEKLKRYAELGWQVKAPLSVSKNSNNFIVTVSGRDGMAVEGVDVELLVRRFGSPHIYRYKAVDIGGGKYQAAVVFNSTGHWEVNANITCLNGNTFTFDNRVYVHNLYQ